VISAPATTVKERDPWRAVFALGITQITAWGSIYYSFALLMEPLQAALGASKSAVVGAFSLSLLTSGLLSPLVGRLIDEHGGRWVMAAGSALGGAALCALAYVTTLTQLYLVWAALGVAMAATLYDPAFAVLTQSFRSNYRRAITALTLFGGFASTIFWPITALIIGKFGWRDAILILGTLQFVVCVPLHFFVLPRRSGARVEAKEDSHRSTSLRDVLRDRVFYLLCLAFTANALVFSAMSVHMLSMLEVKGLSTMQAALVGAMVGPMQVLGRIIEILFERRVSPSTVGVIAMGLLPMSLAVFLIADGTLALFALFALMYGAGNGVMTIVRGTIPVELYGRAHYGAVNGAMAAPVLVSKALGPVAAAFVWSLFGGYNGVVVTLAAIGASSLLFFLVAMRMRAASRMPGSNKSGARSHWPDSHADRGSNQGPAD
jgi:MFS family permease